VKFARRAKTEVEVNLTALIDVVFLLLIFFMVSTTFTKETHIAIDLPEAGGQPMRVTPQQIEVTVSRSGEYAINDVSLVNDQMDTLKTAIEKVSNGDTSLPFIITADAATPHQSVVTAMDAAGQLGFSHLSITTRNVHEEE
jgi:biopolymer transport protein ExbD